MFLSRIKNNDNINNNNDGLVSHNYQREKWWRVVVVVVVTHWVPGTTAGRKVLVPERKTRTIFFDSAPSRNKKKSVVEWN